MKGIVLMTYWVRVTLHDLYASFAEFADVPDLDMAVSPTAIHLVPMHSDAVDGIRVSPA